MSEFDAWAHDYIEGTTPSQVASAMIALGDEMRKLERDAASMDEFRSVEQSEAARKLASLVNVVGGVEWMSSQVMYTLAKRVSALKPEEPEGTHV